MEQRRFFVFFVLSMAIWLAWFQLAVPFFFPNALKPPNQSNEAATVAEKEKQAFDSAADASKPVNLAITPVTPVIEANVPAHPSKTIQLGPVDPDLDKVAANTASLDEFFLAAQLNSQGAAIDSVELTDKKRYPAFGHRGRRVRVLGSDARTPLKTFALRSAEIDKQLGNSTLDLVSWEVVPEIDPKQAERAATFRFKSPDGQWELTKRFELTQLTPEQLEHKNHRDTLVEGYEIKLTITSKNLTAQDQTLSYTLQGPVGIPLEDAENSYKYRDIRMGFLRDDGVTVDESKQSAADTVKKDRNKATTPIAEWARKVKYIGVDVLYFATLILPGADQLEFTKAVVASENREKPEYSDVSVELKSKVITVPANGEVTHEYTLFAGPKRKELIGRLSAMAVMDYGWFDSICRGMVWLLNMFHGLGLSYGIAIICLTALVRTLLMPISKHQAANAAKMKVLQPKMLAKQKELEAKYGKNTEEYMKAAQELSKEQLGLMMSGCLPMFLQLPIFIALYRAIGSSIELRMEPFLWFENLASPDALFKLPFVVPWFGWTHFNLLPCISTGLMFIHQKLTMPPPTNEEQAQQQKMMSYMMIFMGAMFFRVPSGLCLYFIATNVWSMTERWVFEHFKKESPPEGEAVLVGPAGSPPLADGGKPSVVGGFWKSLQDAADNQRAASRQLEGGATSNRSDKKKKKR
ncbi:membrane protein insertase YidC [Schlesneria paludicola]|uniref:membrane protein insertase YidC n=1 Tax=Schlesneria paludicola TaxID=360056 RepID=UPI00029A5AD9|nr:membrane protein insertase YidC [Schlesneria paludicola]